MNKINVRLKKERESLGLTLKQVSEKMGFPNYQTLSSIESGERELKAWELLKLANIYGRNVDYFLRAELVGKKEPAKVLWRNLVEGKERLLNEQRFLSICHNYQRLIELTNEDMPSVKFDLTPAKSDFYRSSYIYVNELAQILARHLDLGSRPACSLPIVLEEILGVKVLYLDLGFGGSGASVVSSDFGEAILINASDAPWRRNYDLAHELFHLRTWNLFADEEIYEKSGKSLVEKWADAFASALLLPEDEVKKEFEKQLENNRISYLNLVEIAREFGVSVEALLWRLVNLALLPRKSVEKLLDEGKIKDIDRKERITDWEEMRPRLSPHYVRLAIKALKTGKVSKAKFAEYVNRPFSEISDFLRRYGYDENEDYSREFPATRR